MSLYRGTHPTVVNFTALLTEEGSGADDAVEDMTAIGGGVKARCDMLLQWTQPGGGSMLGKLVGAAPVQDTDRRAASAAHVAMGRPGARLPDAGDA